MRINTVFVTALLVLVQTGGLWAQERDRGFRNYSLASCCTYIKQMPVLNLERGQTLDLGIHQQSQLVTLSTGPSFAALVRLPVSDKKEVYLLESLLSEKAQGSSGFIPYVAILDKDRQLIISSTLTSNDFLYSRLFPSEQALGFPFVIPPNADADDETAPHYLLVYTRSKHFTDADVAALAEATRQVSDGEISIEYGEFASVVEYRDLYGQPAGQVRLEHIE